ncbi:mucin-17-like isoform X10 [Zerene cesonia]|uniref:mucin-17-like isoform X10 n=1 Tax=Zerene cesonia TaxID=33412 RepID=UPI0018E4E3D2|nr:mucin-17-like isoform X10 [Zerene cesonia]
MRAGVWWGAIALTLLLVASNAIRTVQGEGTSRVSRRPTTTDRSSSNINRAEDYQPTFRPRGIRRREESPEPITPRSRSRSRLPEKENVVAQIDVTQAQQSRPNEQFESRRSNSRTRTRPTEITATSEKTLSRENVIRARSRQSGRRNSPTPLSQTQATVTLSSRSVDTKQDASNVKLDEISKPIPTAETIPANQFRRRSSTVSTLEETKPARSRGRYDSRINTSSLDLEVSGTTNTFTATAKEQSVLRENDLRNSRKLRYKTRTSETDTNLTGDGIVATNEVIKSSQKNDLTSQRETKSPSSSTTERVSSSTGTLKSMKVVRRPISRGTSTKSVVVKNKSKVSDEISEDDNYPESFKALIQAKNATQPNSPSSESLSVKASQVSKTYASPTQSIITGPGTDKNSRLRKKVKLEENSDTDQNKIGTIATTTILTTTTSTTSSTTTTSTTTEQSKSRSSAYRPRGSYLPRNKKVNSTPSDISSTSASPSTERQYKFSRKFKSVTNAPNTDVVLKTKRVDNSITKKPVIRSSLFSRKNDPPNNATVIPLNENRKRDRVQSANYFKVRRTLPSTSYYSRQRNNISSTTETNTVVDTETAIADKKTENSNDLPLIFTYLNNPPKSTNKHNESEKFSRENSTENEIINKAEESENKIIVNTEVTTQKYHANYKGDTEPNQKSVTSATPAIRNIQTRKYGRKPIKTRDQALNSSPVIFKTKERNVRKYSDTFSKTTEAPGNSIQPEPEKPKNKFSSKYRASYLDKPFYKPTVPTVTPSTEQGEEIQLGPELNAIAITKTRRPLTSADLRLSESLTKPLQVLNVEASQHSPSVTVSIFDALAEILTSTPKPRISTTTEVLPKQTTDSNVKQTLNGVSNNVNVNSGTGFASKETVTSKDNLNTNAMFVQTTEQNKQIVFNSMPVGENVTPSLKAEDEKTISVTPPQTTSTPPPTTPLSARKPFAIRVLYSETETPIDRMTTAASTTNVLSTDKPTMTKQIRTEKPDDANGNTVFKFIPIEDVTVASTQESNVLKLASPKIPKLTTVNNLQTTTILSTTEINTQTPQLQMNTESNNEITTTVQTSVGTPFELSTETVRDEPPTPVFMDEPLVTTETQVTTLAETTLVSSVTSDAPATAELSNFNPTPSSILSDGSTTETTTVTTETSYMPTTLPISTFRVPTATSVASATNIVYQMQTERNPKNIGGFENAKILENQQQENAKLLQALLLAMGQKPASKVNSNAITKVQTTTVRSIEEDIRQFEEDTKLLKALLQATGRDPTSLNIPSLGDVKSILTTTPAIATTTFKTSTTPITTTQSVPPTTQASIVKSTTSSINNDIKQLQEDTKLLQALLQATSNRNVDNNKPIISGITSNVRIASNPLTTSMGSNPTTSFNVRPVYTTTRAPFTSTVKSQIVTVSTFQPTTEDIGISTTFQPINKIMSTTTPNSRITITTEIPSSSTYSDEEDLLFLQNLKSVLNTNNKNEDPETALANRVIALAVERSLNEIQQGKSVGTTEVMTTTTPKPTTTTRTTTTRITTTPRQNMLSIEDDIKQFEQDTKLLQALLKATGQDPSKFNIPTLPTVTTTVSVNNPPSVDDDLKLLSNLLASPSPLNEPFDPLTQRPAAIQSNKGIPPTTSIKPQNIKIAVKDDLKNEQDDAKLLQTLIKLQDAQETTTVRSKLAITGHDPDEALKKLIQKTQPAGMMSEATKSSISLSTEYGNSNDALLAALLKEQGFGPTTASSLDEQLRLAALLNQVVVTPKARRTTTPPPPPPAPRRPILDGLAWLWQQWRETGPGPGGSRPSRPASVRQPTPSQATSSRVNWFGSGPFVGNADEGPPANRIPLEPPSAVEQGPGRGQLVSAAINVTRAFSQFLGAAIQGAAQTVQSVFRAGQKAASDMYTNGSGGSG